MLAEQHPGRRRLERLVPRILAMFNEPTCSIAHSRRGRRQPAGLTPALNSSSESFPSPLTSIFANRFLIFDF